jgi:hypothetical protein
MKLTARRPGACLALTLALFLGACGTVRFEAGTAFDPGKLESALRPGISTRLDVEEALGPPYGKGGALLPFHDTPRVAWTYFQERGDIDLGAGGIQDQRVYLFVFFRDDTFDSYMWFTSALAPAKK